MTKITNLTNFSDQVTQLQLPDGTIAEMELIYHGATERWIMNVAYNGKIINGVGLCCYPNILRQFENILPFGIACTTNDHTDPFDINDFSTGRVSMFLLTTDDIAAINASVYEVV